MWTFSTLLAAHVLPHHGSHTDVDPHLIVIMALCALFGIFSVLLLASHVRLIIVNLTTVESLAQHRMREHERALLREAFPWYKMRERHAVKARWDEEWGQIDTEGNIWWLGSARANWQNRMGRRILGWFLPLGSSEGDGLVYELNPRFDADGRPQRRAKWPVELR